jgi:hypothetical protein
MRPDHVSDLVAIGSDNTAGGDVQGLHSLPHPHDEREAGEETKGFSGEAARTQSGWDHGERRHARRSSGGR